MGGSRKGDKRGKGRASSIEHPRPESDEDSLLEGSLSRPPNTGDTTPSSSSSLVVQVRSHASKTLERFSRPVGGAGDITPDSFPRMGGDSSSPPPMCSFQGPPSPPSGIDLKFAEVLAAINTCQSMLVTKVDELKQDFVILRHDVQKIRERTAEAERRISDVEDVLRPLPAQVAEIKRQLLATGDRADDMENRLRRNNIRIVGLPEKSEGANVVGFLESWFKELFPPETFSSFFSIERAHRVPSRPGSPGGPLCPMLAKLLHFRDRDSILKVARLKGEILYQNTRVSFYPDFSATIRRQLTQFTEIRAKLRKKGYSYAMMYPAKL